MGLLTPLAVRIGAQPWMPRLLPQVVWVDEHLQGWSRGRVSVLDLAGLPNLMLTVAGRRSGLPRSTPLLCVPFEGSWLVAGSYFGGPRTPVWVFNLRAAERAEVRVGRRSTVVVPEEVSAGPERDRLWAAMVRVWPNYRLYEQKTDRLIPVFRLTPADAIRPEPDAG